MYVDDRVTLLDSRNDHRLVNQLYSNNTLKNSLGVLIVAQWKRIQLGTMKLRVRSLALLSGLGIQCCCELWCRLVATAPIRPLAWEPPYAAGAALEMAKRQKKEKKEKKSSRWVVPKPEPGQKGAP